MNYDEEGGAAFPLKGPIMTSDERGMSLRDWFAGLAMQGLLANGSAHDENTAFVTACAAYRLADEMLKAREAK